MVDHFSSSFSSANFFSFFRVGLFFSPLLLSCSLDYLLSICCFAYRYYVIDYCHHPIHCCCCCYYHYYYYYNYEREKDRKVN